MKHPGLIPSYRDRHAADACPTLFGQDYMDVTPARTILSGWCDHRKKNK